MNYETQALSREKIWTFLSAPPLPDPLPHSKQWRRGGQGVLDDGWFSTLAGKATRCGSQTRAPAAPGGAGEPFATRLSFSFASFAI